MTKLWSYRFTVARGWNWKLERECSDESAQGWLRVYADDEPATRFVLSNTKPRA